MLECRRGLLWSRSELVGVRMGVAARQCGARAGHGEFRVQNAFLLVHVIGQLPDEVGPAANQNNFRAKIVA